jgi:SNF2 family DNA or RNA helicase
MLPRQPLRYVLADDPGAGKTIMAGLLIRELLMRADAKRVLIVAPGSLVEQWQDELSEKFGVEFRLFTAALNQAARVNAFEENDLLIARLDQLSRNEDLQAKLQHSDWDLIVVDEAHKLSANYFGSKINETKRFKLGKLLGGITRHFLLMTATPHNGKEEDFQIWLSLLDSRPLLRQVPRRRAQGRCLRHDAPHGQRGPAQVRRHAAVPGAARLHRQLRPFAAGVGAVRRRHRLRAQRVQPRRRAGRQTPRLRRLRPDPLQRRLASSPEAIYQSLKRRRNWSPVARRSDKATTSPRPWANTQ